MSEPRIVCQFSCGAASAVATKIILAQDRESEIVIVNAFVQEEDTDNRRFLADCESWFGRQITVLRDEKFGASTHEVWRRKRYMKGPRGAPCSLELKRKLLNAIAQPTDINVIGFTVEEEDRFFDLQDHLPGGNWRAPLIEKCLTKADCLAMLDLAHIQIPRMYRLGFENANCIGCPKGGQNYWMKIRECFPEQFIQIRAIQDEIGPGAYFLQHRSGPRKGERMPLSELPEGSGGMGSGEPSFSCSFFCEMARQDIAR